MGRAVMARPGSCPQAFCQREGKGRLAAKFWARLECNCESSSNEMIGIFRMAHASHTDYKR